MRASRMLPTTFALLVILPSVLLAQGGAEGGGGLYDINVGLSTWTLIVFAGLFLVLSKYAWGPILAAVDAREKGIQSALDEAAQHNADAAKLLEEHRELIDAAFALNEGGGGMARDGEKISNNVQAAEKKFLSYYFTATNPGGHSSLPVKKNAIYDLSQALLAVQGYDFPVMLNEVTEAFFAGSADLVGGEMGEAMRRIVTDPDDAAAAATLSEDTGYNSRLRTTCVATLLEGGHAQNALPQTAQANVNCRLLPSHDPADVRARLQALAEPFEVEVSARGTATPSPPSPLTPEVLEPIERITREMWPGVPVLPVMSTGATDGLYLRREGIPVYGVSGIFGDMDDRRAHGRDERIRIEHFYEGQEFLYRLVKALAGGGGPGAQEEHGK